MQPAHAQDIAGKPRFAIQASRGGVDVAAWSPDSRHIYTASGLSRELLVWDVASGVIIDRARLPPAMGVMKLLGMARAPDGWLQINAEVLDLKQPDRRSALAFRLQALAQRQRGTPADDHPAAGRKLCGGSR